MRHFQEAGVAAMIETTVPHHLVKDNARPPALVFWLVIGVGIAITRNPLLGPGRALVSASGSYLR